MVADGKAEPALRQLDSLDETILDVIAHPAHVPRVGALWPPARDDLVVDYRSALDLALGDARAAFGYFANMPA